MGEGRRGGGGGGERMEQRGVECGILATAG